ncbi:hypothetical protein HDU67_003953 [Dinochytrium kinnereticum]|nr:hypothetical protein HDU67_003953 [Dinochytrium kinnereticum]
MGIDFNADIPPPPPPQMRRPSVMRQPSAGPVEFSRPAPAVTYTTNDPSRFAKIESGVNFVLDDSLGSTLHAMSVEPPPLFGNYELAQVIDMVLSKVSTDSGPAVTAEDIISVFQGPLGDGVDHAKDEEGRKYQAMILAAQIKLKTSNAILNEMGKRMEKLQRWVNEVSTRAAAFEQERTHHVAVVEALKTQIRNLEIRAETSEAAINAFDRIRIEKNQKTVHGKSDLEDGSDEDDENILNSNSRRTCGDGASRQKKPSRKRKERLRYQSAESEANYTEPFSTSLDAKEGFTEDDAPPKEITREIIIQTARIMGVKKRFDPPTALGVGLKAYADREEHLGANPMAQRFLLKSPYQTVANSYRSNKVPRLLHAAVDHKRHLSAVLSAQTQELLATKTPDNYIRVLHTQLNGSIKALHDCIDALSEEQRISEHWRLKWVRMQARLNADYDTKRKEELKALSSNSGKDQRTSISNLGARTAWATSATQSNHTGRPMTVDPETYYAQQRSLISSAFKHQRSKSAEPAIGHSYTYEDASRFPDKSTARPLKSASRPHYQPEDFLLSAPLASIAIPSPAAKSRFRYASNTPQSSSMRAVTAPETRGRQEIIVPAARTDMVNCAEPRRPGEHAPPPTPMPCNVEYDYQYVISTPASREGRVVEFSAQTSKNVGPGTEGVPTWRLNKGSVSSARYRSIVPRIASLGPFLQNPSEAPHRLMKALCSNAAGSKKWDGSVSIHARPRGDQGIEEALRPFAQPGSERKAVSIRSARRLLSSGGKAQHSE